MEWKFSVNFLRSSRGGKKAMKKTVWTLRNEKQLLEKLFPPEKCSCDEIFFVFHLIEKVFLILLIYEKLLCFVFIFVECNSALGCMYMPSFLEILSDMIFKGDTWEIYLRSHFPIVEKSRKN